VGWEWDAVLQYLATSLETKRRLVYPNLLSSYKVRQYCNARVADISYPRIVSGSSYVIQKSWFISSHLHSGSGSDPGVGAIGATKTYESNFIHHDFLQFGKQHSRYKAILSSIFCHSSVVGSILHPFHNSEAVMRLDYQILLKSPPLPLLAGSAPTVYIPQLI